MYLTICNFRCTCICVQTVSEHPDAFSPVFIFVCNLEHGREEKDCESFIYRYTVFLRDLLSIYGTSQASTYEFDPTF